MTSLRVDVNYSTIPENTEVMHHGHVMPDNIILFILSVKTLNKLYDL